MKWRRPPPARLAAPRQATATASQTVEGQGTRAKGKDNHQFRWSTPTRTQHNTRRRQMCRARRFPAAGQISKHAMCPDSDPADPSRSAALFLFGQDAEPSRGSTPRARGHTRVHADTRAASRPHGRGSKLRSDPRSLYSVGCSGLAGRPCETATPGSLPRDQILRHYRTFFC